MCPRLENRENELKWSAHFSPFFLFYPLQDSYPWGRCCQSSRQAFPAQLNLARNNLNETHRSVSPGWFQTQSDWLWRAIPRKSPLVYPAPKPIPLKTQSCVHFPCEARGDLSNKWRQLGDGPPWGHPHWKTLHSHKPLICSSCWWCQHCLHLPSPGSFPKGPLHLSLQARIPSFCLDQLWGEGPSSATQHERDEREAKFGQLKISKERVKRCN